MANISKSNEKKKKQSNSLKTTFSTPLSAKNSKIPYSYFLFPLILTIVAYFPSLSNGFISNWDDDNYVINNPVITGLTPSSIKMMFTQFFVGHYQPVTMIIYALQYKLFGLNPSSFHLFSLILHLINTCLVLIFVHKLFKEKSIALITALFFGIHPMHVESVAWISGLKDLTYTFFFLTSSIFYIKFRENKKNTYIIISIFLFIISLLSKSAALVLPLVFLLTDYYIDSKISRKSLFRVLPLLAISFLFGIISIKTQTIAGATKDISGTFSFLDQFFLGTHSISFYLFKLIFPTSLQAFYFYPQKISGSLPIQYYLAPLLLIIIGILIYKAKKHKKVLIWGVGFFIINLLLYIQIIPVGGAITADRYSYVSYIGLFVILGYGVHYATSEKSKINSSIKRLIFPATIAISLIFSIFSLNRNSVWENGITLFNDLAEKQPEYSMPFIYRGIAFAQTGNYKSAIADANKAIAINPEDAFSYYCRGIMLSESGYDDEALKDYTQAILLKNDYTDAYNNRGNLYVKHDMPNEAINDFNSAARLKPDAAKTYFNRGNAWYLLRNFEKACADWNHALNLGYSKAQIKLNKFCR